MAAILADLDDINANLGETTLQATDENTDLLQISVARIVRGYLSRILDNSVLYTWTAPQLTPQLIREAAAKLIAAQLYLNQNAEQSVVIDENHFAQYRYNEAMAILNGVISGDMVLQEIDPAIITSTEDLTINDFFPIDDTDRAFTLGMNL